MPVENQTLVLDLLEWIGPISRPYEDVIDAWRTYCPRLTIWEDTLDARFIVVRNRDVVVTTAGRNFLTARKNRAFVKPDANGAT